MSKTKTLTVSAAKSFDRKNIYIVLKITDSTEHLPGTTIQQDRMDTLCASPDWKVTITEGK